MLDWLFDKLGYIRKPKPWPFPVAKKATTVAKKTTVPTTRKKK